MDCKQLSKVISNLKKVKVTYKPNWRDVIYAAADASEKINK